MSYQLVHCENQSALWETVLVPVGDKLAVWQLEVTRMNKEMKKNVKFESVELKCNSKCYILQETVFVLPLKCGSASVVLSLRLPTGTMWVLFVVSLSSFCLSGTGNPATF